MFGWNRRKGCDNKGCGGKGMGRMKDNCQTRHQNKPHHNAPHHNAPHHNAPHHNDPHQNKHFHRHHHLNLNEGELEKKYFVVYNPDRKTIEMGIYNGSVITIQKNEQTDPNIVVGVGESRYIIPRILAQTILIK